MENVKEPFSTTEMVAEIFKTMSEASGRGVSCLYQVAFFWRTATEAETGTVQRRHTDHVAAY